MSTVWFLLGFEFEEKPIWCLFQSKLSSVQGQSNTLYAKECRTTLKVPSRSFIVALSRQSFTQ